MGGNTIIGPDQQCPPGMLFDPPSQTCGQTSCTEYSPFGIQNLPHPDDCYQYVECILGNRRILTCPNDLMFDRTVGQCNKAHLVYCPGQPTEDPFPTDPFPTEPWPTEPWPTEPWATEPWPTEPWPTEPWPTEPWPTEPWPTEGPPGGNEPVCRGQVFHAHATDCTRFFICIAETLWQNTCPNDSHWNQLINNCDKPEHARCLSAGGTTTTTTEPPLWPPPDDTTVWPPPEETTTVWPPPEDQWTTPNLLPPNPIK